MRVHACALAGLYISKKIVGLMGGSLQVSSEGLGKGCTFYFSLPHQVPTQASFSARSRPETATPRGVAEESQIITLPPLRVLIVDNKSERDEAASELLSHMGILTELMDSLQALPSVCSSQGETRAPAEVVLTYLEDHAMPLSEVLAAATPSSAVGPRRKLVLVTRMKNTLNGNLSEGYACVSKPVTVMKLRRAFAQLFKDGTVLRVAIVE